MSNSGLWKLDRETGEITAIDANYQLIREERVGEKRLLLRFDPGLNPLTDFPLEIVWIDKDGELMQDNFDELSKAEAFFGEVLDRERRKQGNEGISSPGNTQAPPQPVSGQEGVNARSSEPLQADRFTLTVGDCLKIDSKGIHIREALTPSEHSQWVWVMASRSDRILIGHWLLATAGV